MMKIKEVMTLDVMTCKTTDTLSDCARMMKEFNVGETPIVDDNKKLVGIITDRDITVRAVAAGADPNNVMIADFMTPSPVTITPDTNVEDAADMMADVQVRRLPVVDDNGGLIGIVSLGDLAVEAGEEELVGETLEEISRPVR